MVNVVEKIAYLTKEILKERDLTLGTVLEGIIKNFYYLYSIFDLTCFESKLEVEEYYFRNEIHMFIPYYLDRNVLNVIDVLLYIHFSTGIVEYREKRNTYEKIIRERGKIIEYINYPEFTEVYKVVTKSILRHIIYFANCLKDKLFIKTFTTYPHLSKTDVIKDVDNVVKECSIILKEMISGIANEVNKVAELLKITPYKVEEKEYSTRIDIVFEKDGKYYRYDFSIWIAWLTPYASLHIPKSLEDVAAPLKVYKADLPNVISKILEKKENVLNKEIMKFMTFTLLTCLRYF